MTLQALLKEHKAQWIKDNIVKLGKFYIVNVGDGTLYCGTKKHLAIVDEDNTFIYKVYEVLLDNKGKFFPKLCNKVGYIGLGMFVAAVLEYGTSIYTILGLIITVVLIAATHITITAD